MGTASIFHVQKCDQDNIRYSVFIILMDGVVVVALFQDLYPFMQPTCKS